MAASLRDQNLSQFNMSRLQHLGYDVGLSARAALMTENCIQKNGVENVGGVAFMHCQGPATDAGRDRSTPWFALGGAPLGERHGGIQRDELFALTGAATCVDSTGDHLCTRSTMTDLLAQQTEKLFDTRRRYLADFTARAAADRAMVDAPSLPGTSDLGLTGCMPDAGTSGQRGPASTCAEQAHVMTSTREMVIPRAMWAGGETLLSGNLSAMQIYQRKDPRHPSRMLFGRSERAECRAADARTQRWGR
jgi:hypothetical protein